MTRARKIKVNYKYNKGDILQYKGGFYEGYHNELGKVVKCSAPKDYVKYKIEFLKDGKVVVVEERFLRKVEKEEIDEYNQNN